MNQLSTIGLVMCVWNRIERFHHTLNMLTNQIDKDFNLYVWNNNKEYITEINNIIAEYNNKLNISVIHSEENIGGIGRFYYVKKLINTHETIIFIDDDQDFTSNMVQIFRNVYENDTIKSRWAFRYSNIYTNRERIHKGNVDVNYCGTGGMVLPSKIFLNENLFNIPEKYIFVEDLWLSHFCLNKLNIKLKSIANPDQFIWQINDGKDQSAIDNSKLKNEFSVYLNENR